MAVFACGAKALSLFLVVAGGPCSAALLRIGQGELQAPLAVSPPPAPRWVCTEQLVKLLKLHRPRRAELFEVCRRLYSEQACRPVFSRLGSGVPQPMDAALACESLEPAPAARARAAFLQTDTRRLLEHRKNSLRSSMITGNDRLDLSVVTKKFDWEKNLQREPNDIDRASKSVKAATAATGINDPEVIARANYVRQAAKDLPPSMLGVVQKEAASDASEEQDSNTSSVETASETNATEEEQEEGETEEKGEAEEEQQQEQEVEEGEAEEEQQQEPEVEEGEAEEEQQQEPEVEEGEAEEEQQQEPEVEEGEAEEEQQQEPEVEEGETKEKQPQELEVEKVEATEEQQQEPVVEKVEEKPVQAVSSSVHCADFPHSWTSKNGVTCLAYQEHRLCNSTGGYGPGWGDDFGTFEDWADPKTGMTGKDACCVCGGGRRDQAVQTPAPTMEPPVKSTPVPTPVLGEGIAGSGQYVVACQDNPPYWSSSGGASCEDYEKNEWCMRTGEYGPNWENDWPEFITYRGTNGFTALQACCACGGGSTGVSAAAQATPMSEPASAPKTASAPETTEQLPPKCEDSHSDWKSKNGRTCLDYQWQQWCTSTGLYGPTWQHAWGTFAEWASPETGDSADQVCCACGGGKKLD